MQMIAVFVHFIDKCGQPQDLLLALRRQLGAHNGDNIAVTLQSVITDWGLDMIRSVVVSDNTSNNNSCVSALYKSFDLGMSDKDIKACRILFWLHLKPYC